MRRLFAFVRRDLLIAASYRTGMVFTVLGGLITLTVFYFLARTVGDSPALRGQGDYFSFALVGVALAAALRSLQTSFAGSLREAQANGSLEAMLAAPLSTFRVIAGLAAYPILSGLVRASALLLAGAVLFGAELHVEPVSFAISLAVSLLAFGALGLLSAAFVLVFKRGDPFSYALDALSYLLAGVIYPVEVLPPFLQWVAKLLPATHALRAMRAAVMHRASLPEIAPSLGLLAVFCVLLWPLAAGLLALARRHVERTGTLGQG